jgi:hypothetical protein
MVNSALAAAGLKFKGRIFTPFMTLSLFLAQVLAPPYHLAHGGKRPSFPVL